MKNDTGSCARVVLAIESGFDSYLIAPSYEGVRYSDDDDGEGLNARIEMNILPATELNFEVTSYNKGVTGDYELSVENLGSCGDPESNVNLTVESVVASSNKVLPGEEFELSAGAKLVGQNPYLRYGILISYYLSTDRHLDAGDYQLANDYLRFEGLEIDYSNRYHASVPEGYTPGMYYVIVEIDSKHEVSESDEGDNTFVLPITVIQ
ncbi:hypothetical protein MNB_SUP05-SYMBIONT-4-99 [hydrothermal vent metagenome]|uniref:Uncharacterized protein n=1 Tax=hydrothermal vent metagenome TaxID=652676 RepID=A0A1W1DTA2_9ZZZZ